MVVPTCSLANDRSIRLVANLKLHNTHLHDICALGLRHGHDSSLNWAKLAHHQHLTASDLSRSTAPPRSALLRCGVLSACKGKDKCEQTIGQLLLLEPADG
jgi:hypothetical protein